MKSKTTINTASDKQLDVQKVVRNGLLLLSFAIIFLSGTALWTNLKTSDIYNNKVNITSMQTHQLHMMRIFSRERTLLSYAIISETDPFKVDDNRMMIYRAGSKFVLARLNLIKYYLSENELRLLDKQDELANVLESNIEDMLSHVFDEKKEFILKLIREEVIPKQLKLISILDELSQSIEKRQKDIKIEADSLSQLNSIILILTVIIFIFIAVYIFRQTTSRTSALLSRLLDTRKTLILNEDELAGVKNLVDEKTKYLKLAKETAEQKSWELHNTVTRLVESESYQRILVENMIDGFITADQSGLIISFNPAAEKIFGYKEDEVIGHNVSMLMTESEASNNAIHMARYIEKNEKYVVGIGREVEGRRKDGSILPIDIALNDSENGGKRILTAVVRDISGRILAQQQLVEQKEQLSNILENTDDAYLTLDNDWTITYLSPISEALLGITPDEVVGSDLRDVLPDIVSMFYKMLRATFTTQLAQERLALYGPTMKYLEAHANPTKKGLVIYFRDVTLQRESEEELRLTRETEFRNKEKIRLAAELTSYMKAIDQHALVSATDLTGKIIKINKKFCQVSGYSQEQLLGQDHRMVNSGTHSKDFFADMWATISNGNIWHGEICNRDKSDKLYWVDSTIVPVKNVTGTIEHYISVRIEITEHKRQSEKISHAYKELAEANIKLEQISRIDGLTCIANRRHFDETLRNEISKHHRQQLPLTLILCDIDYFKKYNDTYGHQAGDTCLQKVAHSINSSFSRASDLVARYGGEEFVVVLPDIDRETALSLAEKLRINVQNEKLTHDTSPVSKVVTISVGVTTLIPDKNITMAMLIEQADKSLYLAKEKGRNIVQCFE